MWNLKENTNESIYKADWHRNKFMVTKGDIQFSRSVVSNSLWPHGLQHARLPCLSLTPWRLLKLMSIKSVTPSKHLILYCPLFFLPSIFPSIRVFSNESALHIRWPKHWSFISPGRHIPFLLIGPQSLLSWGNHTLPVGEEHTEVHGRESRIHSHPPPFSWPVAESLAGWHACLPSSSLHLAP